MRLSAITLQGFKSFRQSTRISLHGNPAIIVGPNGCGKSNIIDAIRWVLGESSARQLRGAALTDVISNGSSQRPPASQAVVELLFDNSQSLAPAPWTATAEIRVERRLSRDGEGQYRINDARCRRRDVADLFLGTGLGSNAYAIIEQGTVGRIVEGRPEELRALLEEAGGISRYKERRRESQQRIAETREHLQRLGDLQNEFAQQYQRLQRQAEQARQLRELRQEERRWQWWLLAAQVEELESSLAGLEEQVCQARTHRQQLEQEEKELGSAQERLRIAIKEAENNLAMAQEEQYATQAELLLVEQQWQHSEGEGKALRKRLEEGRVQLARIRDEFGQRTRLHQENQERLAHLAALGLVQVAASRELQEKRNALERQLAESSKEMERMQEQIQKGHRSLAILEAQGQGLHARLQDLERRLGELRRPVQLPEKDLARAQAEALRLQQLLAESHGQWERIQQELRQVEEQVESSQSQWQLQRDILQEKRSQHSALEAVLRALEKQKPDGEVLLSEILTVAPPWEAVVEWLLADRFHAILVQAPEAASPAQRGQWLWPGTGALPPMESDALFHHLRCKGEYLLALYPWFHGLRCAPDLAWAHAHQDHLQAWESWVTPAGEILGRHSLVRLQGEEGASSLRLRQQLSALQKILSTLEDAEGRAAISLEEARSQLQALRRQEQEQQQTVRNLEKAAAQAAHRVVECKANLQAALERQNMAQTAIGQLEPERAQLQEQWTRLEQELQRQRHAQEALQYPDRELRRTMDGLRRSLQEVRQQLGQGREQEHQMALEAQRLQLQTMTTQDRLATLEKEERQFLQQQEIDQVSYQNWQDQHTHLQQLRESLASRRSQAQKTLQAAHQALEDLQDSEQKLRQQIQELVAQQRQLELQITRWETDIQHEQQRLGLLLQEAANLAQSLRENPGAAPLEKDPKTELERIARAITRLGNVNLAAEEELAALDDRQGSLLAQVADVEEALARLQLAMAAMDAESRERFQQTLEKVNVALQEHFATLFSGGKASLESNSLDLLEGGLILRAQPPGKRNGNLQQLSGGEKALTAIALIFALFQLNPAPFCLLDEVDASLDDANIERFCTLLQTLAPSIQFLLISHRQPTLRIAEQLIGVTMVEAGISTVLPVDVSALARETQ
ncbi:MAG: chromosome segregation protein SMC [Acidithiobacillus sp.]|nr:chromosome segregation protein SMC [Acidithiobacillus sp.]